MTASRIASVTGDRYVGANLEQTLEDLERQDIHCQRGNQYEKDERLKALTDGTLNDVRFFICFTESSSLVGVSRNMTYIVAQYGKVLRIRGNDRANSYLWQ
ncbi:hypothetical protein [Geothermobacter ehrlichii]|nr:hypothetical protein [Geothermobacter ehrlichii]